MKKIIFQNRKNKSINVIFEPYGDMFDLHEGEAVEVIGYSQIRDYLFHIDVWDGDQYNVWVNGFESGDYNIIKNK